MEGKEIIENMTKGIDVIQSEHDKTFVYGLDQKGWLGRHGTPNMVNRFSLKVSDDNRMMKPFEAEANAYLICEAFNVANKTGLTPSQLHSELEKAKELLKSAQFVFKFVDPNRIGEVEYDQVCKVENSITTLLEGSGNKTK